MADGATRRRRHRFSLLGAVLTVLGAAAVAALALVVLTLVGGGSTSGTSDAVNAGAGAPAVDRDGSHAKPRPNPYARLDRTLAASLKAGGPHVGAAVATLGAGGATEFTLRGTTARPPASVEKLYTTLAVLRRLGPDARLRTQVLGAGHFSRGGRWVGNLYLQGGGDPTFGDGTFQRVYLHGEGSSVTDLAHQLAANGIKRVTGRVIGDASLFDNARGGMLSKLAADVPDFGGQLSALVYDHGATMALLSPGAFAAHQLTVVMKTAGITATPAPGVARTPHRAHHLASVSSPPMWQLLRLMDVPSDDLFAEMLTKLLGSRFDNHKGTIAGGARVIAREIRAYGIHPKIIDGSGLSRQDQSSPAQVVSMLSSVWHTPDGRVLAGSLPVVGQTGTVQRIAPKTVAAGRCVAKTGTLDAVTNLAGYCRTLHGHTVAFAVFIDGPDNQTALGVIGRFAVTLVRDG